MTRLDHLDAGLDALGMSARFAQNAVVAAIPAVLDRHERGFYTRMVVECTGGAVAYGVLAATDFAAALLRRRPG